VPGWSSGKTNSNLLVAGIPRVRTGGDGAVTGARARQTETPGPRARAVAVLWPCAYLAQEEADR